MKKRTSSMSRRIVSLLMSLVLTLTLVTPAAFAEGMGAYANGEDTEILTGTNSGDSYEVQEDTLLGISLYAAADSWDGASIAAVEPNAEGIYEISTAAQLAGLAALVNGTAKDTEGNPIAAVNFSGKTIKLTADIDLGNQAWTPIGNGDSSFAFFGTFDGNGYTISGLNVPDTNAPGLFGCIFGTVQNLIVKGSVTVGENADGGDYGEGGGVVCENRGTVQNCGFYGSVIDETGYLFVGGVAGGGYGKVLNCWYYKDAENSALGVCGDTATTTTNCVVISSSDNMTMTAGKLATLQTNAPETGKAWSWTEGALYPKLIDPPKAITMQPVFPDCTAVVSANGTPLSADKKYTCEVTEDSVVITVSDSSKTLYYAANEGENTYTTEGENANLTKLESGTTFNKNDLPKTYYYGTEEDFRLLAAWNSAVSGKNVSITEANQLKALARMVNSGKDSMTGKTIMLGTNIVWDGSDWTPIGTEENPFKGTFTGYSRSGGYAAISGLSGDLFGVVEDGKTKIQFVTISGGTGRLVNTLISGTVENCMSTAKVTGAGGGLVGTSTGTGTGTVKNSYYYNENCKNTVAVSGDGTITNCYYLADTSTWGQTRDSGARTEAEFKAGRVTWELNGKDAVYRYNVTTYWSMGENDLPCLETYNAVYELTLTVNGTLPEGASLQLGDASIKVLTDGNTQYVYGANSYGAPMVPVSAEVPDGYQVMYSPNAPTNGKFKIDGFTKANNYYTVEFVKGDISWYEANKDSKSYAFKTADELVGFSLLVNGSTGTRENFEGWTLTLADNINLDGIAWTPIGQSNAFSGTFDGKGHTIEDMSANVTSGYAGLFGNVRGTVKNVQVTGSVATSAPHCIRWAVSWATALAVRCRTA